MEKSGDIRIVPGEPSKPLPLEPGEYTCKIWTQSTAWQTVALQLLEGQRLTVDLGDKGDWTFNAEQRAQAARDKCVWIETSPDGKLHFVGTAADLKNGPHRRPNCTYALQCPITGADAPAVSGVEGVVAVLRMSAIGGFRFQQPYTTENGRCRLDGAYPGWGKLDVGSRTFFMELGHGVSVDLGGAARGVEAIARGPFRATNTSIYTRASPSIWVSNDLREIGDEFEVTPAPSGPAVVFSEYLGAPLAWWDSVGLRPSILAEAAAMAVQTTVLPTLNGAPLTAKGRVLLLGSTGEILTYGGRSVCIFEGTFSTGGINFWAMPNSAVVIVADIGEGYVLGRLSIGGGGRIEVPLGDL